VLPTSNFVPDISPTAFTENTFVDPWSVIEITSLFNTDVVMLTLFGFMSKAVTAVFGIVPVILLPGSDPGFMACPSIADTATVLGIEFGVIS
jgi:hypothetical protein